LSGNNVIITFQIRCEIEGSNMEIKEGSRGKRRGRNREEKEKEQFLFS
jgi:hypothetical protein